MFKGLWWRGVHEELSILGILSSWSLKRGASSCEQWETAEVFRTRY